MSEHTAEKDAPRATIAEALAAWEAKGPTSLTVALVVDALYGVREALADPANSWWHTGGTPCVPRRAFGPTRVRPDDRAAKGGADTNPQGLPESRCGFANDPRHGPHEMTVTGEWPPDQPNRWCIGGIRVTPPAETCHPKTGWLSGETYCEVHGRAAGWPCTHVLPPGEGRA